MKPRTLILLAAMILCVAGADWPQWRGPGRNGLSKETGLLKTWPKDGPPLVWTFKAAGIGYSCPAVAGNRLYMMGARGATEYLFALDAANGQELWSAKIGPTFTFQGNQWGDGPRATPTVAGDAVYALGGQGTLICVQASDGKERWRKDLPKDLGAEVNPIGGGPEKIGWGFSWSPLVDGDKLICIPGGPQGLFAALDNKTGAVLWRSKEVTDQATYSSPLVADIGGTRQYLELTNAGVVGVAAGDGKLLWYYKREEPFDDVTIPTPIVSANLVYITAVKGGCDLVKVTGSGTSFRAEKVYANRDMDNREGGVVLVGEHIYGYSEGPGWTCQDFKTGERVWADKRKLSSRGSLMFADGRLYCYTEREGICALVEPSPKEKWKEVSRFEIPAKSKPAAPSARIWTHPVIANGRLYLRDQELLFCFDIREKK